MQTPAAALFFQSLIQAIDKVEGRFVVELRDGTVITQPISFPGQFPGHGTIEWGIQPNTCATLTTSYTGGVLSGETQLKFSPAVRLTPRFAPTGNPPRAISSIRFNRLGVPVEYINSLGTPDPGLLNTPFVREQFNFASSLPDLLTGKIFATLNPANGAAHTPAALIRTIGFRKGPVCNEPEPVPGLKVTLKDRSLLIFSQSTPANPHNNSVTLQSPSGFEFDSIIYNVQTRSADGVLASIELNIQSGLFSSGGAELVLRQDSQLSVGRLTFHHDEQGNNSIDGTFGTLSGSLGLGSRLALSPNNASNLSSLTFDDGSKVTLGTFRLNVTDQRTEISVGSSSSALFRLIDGRLSLGANNFVLIRDGILLIDITRAGWASNAAPTLLGTIGLLACDVYAGQFQVENPAVVAALKGGTLRGSGLRLDASNSPPVTGQFSSFVLDLQDGTSFGLRDRFTAVLRDGARITANDPQRPLQITTGDHPIRGAMVATLPFRRVFTTDPEGPVVRNGNLRSTITVDAMGNVSATNVFLDGQVNLSARLFDKQVTATIDVAVEDGSWNTVNGTPVLDATLQAKITTYNASLRFKAPDCPLYGVARNDDIQRGHIKYLIYPIDVELALTQPIVIPPSRIIKTGTSFSFGPAGSIRTLDSEFTMSIPLASYIDDDDQFKASWPHLIKADCVSTGIGGTNDLRLAPNTYRVPFNITLESASPGVQLRVHPRFPGMRMDFDPCLSDRVVIFLVFLAAFAFDPAKTIDAVNNNNPAAVVQRTLNQQFAQRPIKFLQ
jgi:hypothetical protein